MLCGEGGPMTWLHSSFCSEAGSGGKDEWLGSWLDGHVHGEIIREEAIRSRARDISQVLWAEWQ